MTAIVSLTCMKKTVIALILCAISYLGIALPAASHEFWLEPQKYQPETGATLQVQLRNGQEFKGIEIGYFDKRIEMFDWIQNQSRKPVISRAGDFPAMTMSAEQDGLMVLAYESTYSTVQYSHLGKFISFAEHKDLGDVEARHKSRDLPEGRFSEIYTRFCKTLIGIGTAAGQDVETGMETEFVVLTNPYTDDLVNGLKVQLFYQGLPRAKAQIEVFERSPDAAVVITTLHTDDQGNAVIPVKSQHTYLLDAVVLREPDETIAAQNNVVWETLWASTTFYVP